MSQDANDFIAKLLALGVRLELDKQTDYDGNGSDFDGLTSSDAFVIEPKAVKMFRDSEHYFTTSIILNNGNMIHISAPINKISLSTGLLGSPEDWPQR